MERKNRLYIILTGIVIVTLIWLNSGNKNKAVYPELLNNKEPVNNSSISSPPSTNTIEGILWPSDNESRGNLMLISNQTTIYIKTARNFQNLIGKEVTASIKGNPENFELLNIEENLTKNGFIQVH